MMTDRLVIRNFERNEADLKALYLLLSDVEVNKYLPWYPVKNMEETESFYEERIAPKVQVESKGYYFAVCLQEDNIPIGYVTVGTSPSYDFGYGLRKDFWGRGIITEASEVVLTFLKEKKYPFITATHDVNNASSGRVMQKLGMTYRYSYRELWQPKNKWITFRMYQLDITGGKSDTYMGYWKQYPDHFIEEIK